MPIIKDPVSRVWRIISHFSRSVYDSKGCSGKWAMCLYLGGWLRTRLDILRKRKIILLTFRETQFFVDISRHEICPYWEMWYEKNYEAFSQFKASEESCIVDVGGHIGFYTVRQALRAKRGHIITFEPSLEVFDRLRRNIEANNLHNVTAINKAVGDTQGIANFEERKWSINSGIVENKSETSREVKCTRLDEVLKEMECHRIDVLKIDTEGYEENILIGAEGILDRVARIVFETHYETKREEESVSTLLGSYGFKKIGTIGNIVYYEK